MLYKNQCIFTKETTECSYFSEEQVCRELLINSINSIPFNDLKEMVNFTVIDPLSEESLNKLKGNSIPPLEKEELINLKNLNQKKYSINFSFNLHYYGK